MKHKNNQTEFIERRNHVMRAVVEEAIFFKERISLGAAGDILDAFQVPGHVIWRVFIENGRQDSFDPLSSNAMRRAMAA